MHVTHTKQVLQYYITVHVWNLNLLTNQCRWSEVTEDKHWEQSDLESLVPIGWASVLSSSPVMFITAHCHTSTWKRPSRFILLLISFFIPSFLDKQPFFILRIWHPLPFFVKALSCTWLICLVLNEVGFLKEKNRSMALYIVSPPGKICFNSENKNTNRGIGSLFQKNIISL